MSEDKYSVIMTGFDGNLFAVGEAIEGIFGCRGLDLFSIAFFDKELPSELIADISLEKAIGIASALEPYGARVEVRPTAEVQGVLHRADELWPMRRGEHYDFIEIDEMVFSAPALNARQNLKHARDRDGKLRDWTYEAFINHDHVGFPPDDGNERELIRTGYRRIEDLKQDLSRIYPNKSFVISHEYSGSVVSFWQATEDAPKETIPAKDRSPEKTWCPHCGTMQPYIKRTERDAEFPEADWGDCAVCGNEVIVAAPEVLLLVGPET